MKNIDIRTHTKKYIEFAKKAKSGEYPSKKVARVGSIVGLGVGVALLDVGLWGITQSAALGISSLVLGGTTGISNIINLKRISNNNKQ